MLLFSPLPSILFAEQEMRVRRSLARQKSRAYGLDHGLRCLLQGAAAGGPRPGLLRKSLLQEVYGRETACDIGIALWSQLLYAAICHIPESVIDLRFYHSSSYHYYYYFISE